MKKQNLIASLCVGLLAIGLTGNVFAGKLVGSEGGAEILATPQAVAAAQNHQYEADYLAAFATEGGTDVVASQTAQVAAQNHQYNPDQLAAVATEGGVLPYGPASFKSNFECSTNLAVTQFGCDHSIL